MDTKEGKNFNSRFESIVTIREGKIRYVSGDYIVQLKAHFGGGTMKWFDDRKLVKGGVV